jgi:predicted SprT family Zn-dependent metalloprotease
MPKALPPVVLADKETVARYACAGKCRAAGAYHPRYGIALDRSLDPLNDDLARSILLHELVHYLQHENQLYADKTDCARWFKREEHAYSAQQQYLRKVQSTSHVAISLNNPCEAGAS